MRQNRKKIITPHRMAALAFRSEGSARAEIDKLALQTDTPKEMYRLIEFVSSGVVLEG